MKLTSEEKETLKDLLDHEGMSLWIQYIQWAAREIEQDVLKLDAETASNDALRTRKAKGEGARMLAIRIAGFKEALRGKESS